MRKFMVKAGFLDLAWANGANRADGLAPSQHRVRRSEFVCILRLCRKQTEGVAMDIEFHVQNVKCNGCANTIQVGLSKDPRVQAVQVDVPGGKVTVQSTADIRAELSAELNQLGYPEKAT